MESGEGGDGEEGGVENNELGMGWLVADVQQQRVVHGGAGVGWRFYKVCTSQGKFDIIHMYESVGEELMF